MTLPLLPVAVAYPMAELHAAGEFSDVAERGEADGGLVVSAMSLDESDREGVECCTASSAEPGDADFVVVVVVVLDGWKAFIVILGRSSTRRPGCRRVDGTSGGGGQQ